MLCKTKRQAQKVSQVGSGKSSNSPLYSETKKIENFLNKKMFDHMLLKVMQVIIMLISEIR